MATGVKDLKLWQESVALGGDIIRAVRLSNRRETKGFTDRIMTTGADVAARVAEGYSRFEVAEQRPLFLAARRALCELETYLAIARHAGLIPPATLTQLATKSANVSRLLSGYLGYLDRQLEQDRDAGRARANGSQRAPPAADAVSSTSTREA